MSRIVAATGREILGELVAGATHEPVGLREGQKIPTGTRPCKLQLGIGHVDGWCSAHDIVFKAQSMSEASHEIENERCKDRRNCCK